MEICIDFDGTCVSHEYPKIGRDIGAIPVLRKLVTNGHKIILYTMRSNVELMEAVNWFEENNIPLYGINKNPTQEKWTSSPKAYAQLYIDDAAIGCPLIHPSKINDSETERPYVDWEKVECELIKKSII